MKSNEVLRILNITRPTLCKYVKEEKIKAQKKPNGQYDYDENSVYALLNKNIERKTYLYARVSTSKQKKDLENQIEIMKNYCFSNGYKINGVFSDIASGISFEKRTGILKLLDEVIEGKVKKVIITYKDRLSRVGFDLFYYLFKKYNCEIVVISEVGSKKLDSEEIFEEIISLLHCYSMKLYSKRRKIKELINDDE